MKGMDKRRGVTLVEVIVAVSVLLVLATILLVVSARSRERGKVATCLSNLHQIDVAYRLYAEDNNDSSPIYSIGSLEEFALWRDALEAYVISDEVFFCPADKNARNESEALEHNLGRSYFTSYSMWLSRASVATDVRGRYATLLSAVPDPAKLPNMNDYTITDPSKCFVDDKGAFYLNYSPHGEKYSVLYWDGHAKHEVNPWYQLPSRTGSPTCP